MSIFSLIMTTYFNASLSTLLTKRPLKNHITNFEELRKSGMPVFFGTIFRSYFEVAMQSWGFTLDKHQVVFLHNEERIPLLLKHNSSVAFQLFSHLWDYFNKYQVLYNRKTLCRHQELNILDTFPYHFILQHNSVYKMALNEYINGLHDFGYIKHWTEESLQIMFALSTRNQIFFVQLL